MERKPKNLTIINESVEKLAKDLVEFLKKNYGQGHVGYGFMDYNVRRVFWKEKGVDIPVQQDGSPESKLLQDQILRAEFIAREIMKVELDYSQLLKGKNEKELIAELVAFTGIMSRFRNYRHDLAKGIPEILARKVSRYCLSGATF